MWGYGNLLRGEIGEGLIESVTGVDDRSKYMEMEICVVSVYNA